ncbi:TerC family protein [Paraliomyxa miuraensis]|uniref:TerC family protein n=1 Tax=Paraliomyxa miuraensis TaxID=376150 RepID=UPI00225432E6|nr:TerC family protein [Paraliomyxa miuraensis]MCX4245879.1 TerC family protein [Paraliomyxa miuraensis]
MFHSVGSPALWVVFLVGIGVLLAIDLGLFHRQARTVTTREALIWSCVWVALSLCFNGLVYLWFGSERALEFLSAYVIEKSLSVDNLFVFIVIFRYMDVRQAVMHRVLFAGILGALILRGVFIVVGIGLIETFSWTLYIFGLFLLVTGVKLLFAEDDDVDPSGNLAYRLARKVLPLTRRYHGSKFFVRETVQGVGKLHATPLLIVLLMIETSDVVFALDSIPAVFGISRDPFIVFTSNVCAVLGLRAMFFLLQNVLDKFAYLKYGLGLVLAYIGAKMLLAEGLIVIEPIHIPIGVSLGIVAGLISASMVVSLLAPPDPKHQEVLDNTDAASLIAQVPIDASLTTTNTDVVLVRKTRHPRSDDSSSVDEAGPDSGILLDSGLVEPGMDSGLDSGLDSGMAEPSSKAEEASG